MTDYHDGDKKKLDVIAILATGNDEPNDDAADGDKIIIIATFLMAVASLPSRENENPDEKAAQMLTSTHFAAALLLTLALLTPGLRAEQEALRQSQQTRELTLEKVLHTAVSTSTYTVVVYPTCTTSVAGVSACRDAHVPNLSHMIHPEASRAPLRGR